MSENKKTPLPIYLMQIASISLIWIFVTGITLWITRLITMSIKLKDAPDLSVGISIVVIPVFFILAGTLTYVFVGLQRHRTEDKAEQKNEAE